MIEHPAVLEAAVVPSPDTLRLLMPKAFIALREGYPPSRETAESILAFARRKLASYMRIRCIKFAKLPKTISGKILRLAYRNQALARTAQTRGAHEFWDEDFDTPA